MPFGTLLLFVVAAMVFFGLAHRVLDRMRLTDSQALLFIGLTIAGSYVQLPLGDRLSVNLGGAVLPAALAVYVLARADRPVERIRAALAAILTATAIFALGALTAGGPHPGTTLVDPLWTVGLTAGVLGYLAGRSRRGAFIAGTLGVVLADVAQAVQGSLQGVASEIAIGGAGVFDQVVIGGVLAVALCEIVGETREAMQGGPDTDSDRSDALHKDEGVQSGQGENRHD